MQEIFDVIDRYDLITLSFLLVCIYGVWHDRLWRKQPRVKTFMLSKEFGCVALGMAAFYLTSLISDIGVHLSLPTRIIALVLTGIIARWSWRDIEEQNE